MTSSPSGHLPSRAMSYGFESRDMRSIQTRPREQTSRLEDPARKIQIGDLVHQSSTAGLHVPPELLRLWPFRPDGRATSLLRGRVPSRTVQLIQGRNAG